MSKRILASIACLGIVWVVGANAERLLAEEDPFGNTSGDQVAATQITEEEEEDDAFGGMPSMGSGMGMGRGGMYMGGGSIDAPHPGRDKPSALIRVKGWADSQRELREIGSAFSRENNTQGTFTVVSDGKRSILLNETTGDSWLLFFDNPGSHWEPIAMGVSKGGRTEIKGPAALALESAEDFRKHRLLEDAALNLKVTQEKFEQRVGKLLEERASLKGEVHRLNDELKETRLKLAAALGFREARIQNEEEEEEVEEKRKVEENAATSENPFE